MCWVGDTLVDSSSVILRQNDRRTAQNAQDSCVLAAAGKTRECVCGGGGLSGGAHSPQERQVFVSSLSTASTPRCVCECQPSPTACLWANVYVASGDSSGLRRQRGE